MDTYYNSIGRNGTLLLNFPIDLRGLIHENDVKAAHAFADAVKKANAILDGDPSTAWRQNKDKKMLVDLVIDLGKEETLSGFRYLPDQNMWDPVVIASYQFYISQDNEQWKLVSEGEFSNIKNNPLWQTKTFASTQARYIKLRALSNTQGNDAAGYAEIDVITQGK